MPTRGVGGDLRRPQRHRDGAVDELVVAGTLAVAGVDRADGFQRAGTTGEGSTALAVFLCSGHRDTRGCCGVGRISLVC